MPGTPPLDPPMTVHPKAKITEGYVRIFTEKQPDSLAGFLNSFCVIPVLIRSFPNVRHIAILALPHVMV